MTITYTPEMNQKKTPFAAMESRMSFYGTHYYVDTALEIDVRIIDVECFDKTGTNDFVIVRITRNSREECEREFFGQLSDGIFENSRIGKIEEINAE